MHLWYYCHHIHPGLHPCSDYIGGGRHQSFSHSLPTARANILFELLNCPCNYHQIHPHRHHSIVSAHLGKHRHFESEFESSPGQYRKPIDRSHQKGSLRSHWCRCNCHRNRPHPSQPIESHHWGIHRLYPPNHLHPYRCIRTHFLLLRCRATRDNHRHRRSVDYRHIHRHRCRCLGRGRQGRHPEDRGSHLGHCQGIHALRRCSSSHTSLGRHRSCCHLDCHQIHLHLHPTIGLGRPGTNLRFRRWDCLHNHPRLDRHTGRCLMGTSRGCCRSDCLHTRTQHYFGQIRLHLSLTIESGRSGKLHPHLRIHLHRYLHNQTMVCHRKSARIHSIRWPSYWSLLHRDTRLPCCPTCCHQIHLRQNRAIGLGR